VIAAIAARAAAESPVWGRSTRVEIEGGPLFGPVAGAPFDRGLETIYEGYLVHHGQGRAFAASDRDERVLLGDYLYAAGLVDVCAAGDVEAVATLATLISLTAHARAENGDADDDARLWLAAARHLAGARDGRFRAACDALREHDPLPLRRLVTPDPESDALLRRHAAHLERPR
jgi:hypothetical protein